MLGHLMSSYILCVFEGQKTEPNIANSLWRHLLDDGSKVILKASYGCNLYKLYEEIIKDEFFDTHGILVEQIQKRGNFTRNDEEVLAIEDLDEISDIYLFFDYDCHCSNANDAKLGRMLNTFNDPQDRGLLCISYPMVEAIKHQKGEEVIEELHSINDLANYKKWVNANQEFDKDYLNSGLYTADIWKSITENNLARANILVNDDSTLPMSQIEQNEIFAQQLVKHIPNEQVAVLSSFLLMVFDYYGNELYNILGCRASTSLSGYATINLAG